MLRLNRCLRAFGFTSLALAVAVGAASCASSAGPVTILANPGPFRTVDEASVAEDRVSWGSGDRRGATACTESFAATELRHFLAMRLELPEARIALQSTGTLPERGQVFVLTSDPTDPRLAGLDTATVMPLPLEGGEGFRIFTVTEPHRTVYVIQGAGPVGTLYGTYTLLWRFGVHFYGLGEAGTVVANRGTALPKALRLAEKPAFLTRGFWAFEPRGNREFFLWMARNRLNLWTAEDRPVAFLHKLGLRLTKGGHIIQQAFLDPATDYPYHHLRFAGSQAPRPDPYPVGAEYQGDRDGNGRLSNFEAHPEWFGLIDGRRSDHRDADAGDNFCTSNSDATKELTGNLLHALETGDWRDTDILVFWMLDNGRWCECSRCRALGSPTDRLFQLLRVVRDSLREATASGALGRPVLLTSLAFLETMSPPTRPLPPGFDAPDFALTYFPIYRCYVHSLADSSCTEINQQQEREYQQWAVDPSRLYRGAIAVGEYYNVSSLHSLPVVYTHILRDDIPWYYRHAARHFNFMHVMTRSWGPWTLNHTLMAQLLWNPDLDVDGAIDEFFKGYFPATADSTRRFFESLERATANFKLLKHQVLTPRGVYGLGRQMRGGVEPLVLAHLQYRQYRPDRNDGPDIVDMKEELRIARGALDHALARCPRGIELTRLQENDRALAYAEATLDFFDQLVRLYILDGSGHSVEARRDWPRLKSAATRLRGVVDLVQASALAANPANGLEATEVVDIYEAFARKYDRADGARPGGSKPSAPRISR